MNEVIKKEISECKSSNNNVLNIINNKNPIPKLNLSSLISSNNNNISNYNNNQKQTN